MFEFEAIKDKVLKGALIGKEEALALAETPLDVLAAAASEIQAHFCGRAFDLCAIINAKSGKCSEDCKFCAQSAHNNASIEEYGLLPAERILNAARAAEKAGILRFSMVTSGGALTDAELDSICLSVGLIRRETTLSVCLSPGLLSQAQYRRLAEAGVDRIHNNLESSERYFPQVCTTHSWHEKTAAIMAARAAGLSVCSGGIIGMGETMADRIDMALSVRALGVRSIPVNILNPIKGTPYGTRSVLSEEEVLRTVAIFRFIIPNGAVRMAGGRGLIPGAGSAFFTGGSNAAITGDMLTTAGIAAARDIETACALGYEVKKIG